MIDAKFGGGMIGGGEWGGGGEERGEGGARKYKILKILFNY